MMLVPKDDAARETSGGASEHLASYEASVSISAITTTQVTFAPGVAVTVRRCRRCRALRIIKRDISWQSPVFFYARDKQGGLREPEFKALILAQYQAAVSRSNVFRAIIITGESAKTRNARPGGHDALRSRWRLLRSPAPGRIWNQSLPYHGAGAQVCPEQRMCRVLNIDTAAARLTTRCRVEKSAAPPALTSVVACWKPTLRGAREFMPISRGR